MKPAKVIVPIFGVERNTREPAFLGTGAFVGEPPLLVTAHHILADWHGSLGIIELPGPECDLLKADVLDTNTQADLALLQVPGYSPLRVLELAQDHEIQTDVMVKCLEYSPTARRGHAFQVNPATRIGNVTRKRDLSDLYGQAGDDILELSFPALSGASGAPVLSRRSNHLWGILKANVSYHLSPAQILTVLEGEDQIYEETRFMLPQGLAIHVKHLRAMLAALDRL
jgi:hypothetical protein